MRNIAPALLMMLCGTLASMIIGFIFYGSNIFDASHYAFQFFIFGFGISTLISVGQHFNVRIYIITCFFVTLVIIMPTFPLVFKHLSFLLRDSVFAASFSFSIYGGLIILSRYKLFRRDLNKIALWLMMIIIAFLISSVILSVVHRPQDILGYFQFQIVMAILIGLGVSIGTTISGIFYPGRETKYSP